MQEHCHIKEGLPCDAFFLIDWDAIEDATASSPNLFNLWMTKQVSGFCAVGKMMKRWRFWENSKCHSCDEPKEDATHILYCPHDDCHKAWDEAIMGFEVWMQEVKTDPDIQYCFLTALRARDPHTLFCAYVNSPKLQLTAEEQDCIGWKHFMKGRVARGWRDIQDDYYQATGSKQSSRWWMEGLVSNLLSFVHKQWLAQNAVVHARDEHGLKVREG